MVQSLFTLFIFLVIASCLPPLLKGVSMVESKLDPSKEYEWNLFSHQFRNEFRGADSFIVTGNAITFMKNDEEILYEVYGDFLRRRVNRRGHEIVLGPLNTIEFSSSPSGVEITAGFEREKHVTGRFFTYGQ